MGDELDALTNQLGEGFQVDPAALGKFVPFFAKN